MVRRKESSPPGTFLPPSADLDFFLAANPGGIQVKTLNQPITENADTIRLCCNQYFINLNLKVSVLVLFSNQPKADESPLILVCALLTMKNRGPVLSLRQAR
jgi:hypothetical protein